jgi:ATP-dependent Clp protease ATP-binding subunit ClpC
VFDRPLTLRLEILMFERYTEPARRALFFARYEVSLLGATSIEPDHLVLGLLREEGQGLVGRLFAELEASPESIRHDIERRFVRREKVSTAVEIPFSEDTKRAWQFAAEEADRLQHFNIAPEHLFLGLVRADAPVLTSLLATRGLQLDDVRKAMVKLAAEAPVRSAAPREHAQQIDDIQGAVRQLGEALSGTIGARELLDRISSDLDLLRSVIEN